MAKLPHSQRGQQLQQQSQRIEVREQWSGPLPPPAALERFNQILPNGAERIVAMAEKEQSHRIEYEKMVLQQQLKKYDSDKYSAR